MSANSVLLRHCRDLPTTNSTIPRNANGIQGWIRATFP